MSIRPDDGRNVEGALEPRIQVEEKSQETVDQYPPDIEEQLKRAAFSEGDAANTYVKHVTTSNSTPEPKVVTVEVRDDSLVIDVEDVVGIVNLTPNATLQIDPKIGWSDILEMFLAVGEQRRTLQYQGIPIREFLADDIGIEDVFIVVAVNYLNSLEDIFRHGFIRSFERRRTTAFDARGRIDITNSLRNFDFPNGIPQHEFVQKIVEYSIPVNDLIYKAGIELQRLFHRYASQSSNANHTRIFARLERAIKRVEQRGITGESISLSDVPNITTADIPRQRHYYSQAIEVSKSILSSTIGRPLDQGREELLMEYILGMNSLFEEYSAFALEKELENLKEDSMIEGLDDVAVGKKSYQLFTDDEVSYRSQPDHVITSAGDPIAVLDSKYYSKKKDLLKGGRARSRLLSYGFHLETDKLGMIAPLAEPESYPFAGRSGELTIISPDEDEFSTEGLRRAIRDYLRTHVGEQREMGVITDLENRRVCHPDVSASALDDVVNQPALQADRIPSNSRKILQYIIQDARLSDEVHPRDTRRMLGPNRKFKQYLQEEAEDYDLVVPFFLSASDPETEQIINELDVGDSTEFIKIHCLAVDENGDITDHTTPSPFGFGW